ncbi:hypothetical protein CVT24_011141 [Panaeolus cyanescens]|uniref:FAD/NAD(P)-binding domain-containing protein n=1 Tax=Panaeolus cyanescens TaxID=181874 RepID=A0A409YGA3_9AGAR|nr:hypothetical protein CVT24_011141 [Panaeolus cyanescens]
MSSSTRQNIVIVGGGFAGIGVFNQLYDTIDASKYDLFLISDRDYVAYYPAALRMSISPEDDLENQVLMKYNSRFNQANKKTIIGKVTTIDQRSDKSGGTVTLANGQKVEWAFLVLTPGGRWEGIVNIPEAKKDVGAFIRSWKSKVEKANDIVLIGGGAVGIEAAGEIKEYYPRKNVTIVHGSDSLLNASYPAKFRSAATKRVIARGVNVILNDYIDEWDECDGKVTTRNGKFIVSDLVIQARGFTPNTDFVASSLGEETITRSKTIKVLPTLQLGPNHPRIFAGGDVIDWPEQKQAGKVAFHAAVIAKNIVSMSQGKGAPAIYKGAFDGIIITIGKTQGVGFLRLLWGIVLGNWFSAWIKSKNLMVEMSRKSLKLDSYATSS